MTRSIEQELTALFHDAVAHLEIQPLPVRRSRTATLGRAVAVGLAAAVVAGLVLVSLRLAGGGSQRTEPAGPTYGRAAETLLAAMERTWSQPLRIHATTTMDDVPSAPGAPDPAPQTTSSVTEIDFTRDVGVVRQADGPTIMAVDGHLYAEVRQTDVLNGSQLPASVRWYELPTGSAPATLTVLGVASGGVSTADDLRDALAAGRASVFAVGPDRYRLIIKITPQKGHDDPHWRRGVEEIIHVSPDGLVDTVTIDDAFGAGSGIHMTGTAHIEPLNRGVDVQAPDPSTVTSQDMLRARTATGDVTACPSNDSGTTIKGDPPADSGTTVQCTSAGVTVGASPQRRHGRR